MKKNLMILFLFWFSNSFCQEVKHCRYKEEDLKPVCEGLEEIGKGNLPVEIMYQITAKNSDELTRVKNWAEQNGYKTNTVNINDSIPAIELKKDFDSFACTFYYNMYSHIEVALDKMGIGCFLTMGVTVMVPEIIEK